MKILVADPISFTGHVNYNYGIIKALLRDYEIGIISNEKMKASLVGKGISSQSFVLTYDNNASLTEMAKKYKNKMLYHLAYRVRMNQIFKDIARVSTQFDATILTSVDMLTFLPSSYRFGRNTLVVDHDIGRIFYSNWYKNAWRFSNKKIKLVVLEEFIKESVQKELTGRTITVVHHPLPYLPTRNLNERKVREEVLLLAPSASNDNEFIEQLKSIDIPDGLKVVIKGKENYESKGLKVYNNRISDIEYINAIADASVILLPYVKSYNYRTSAVLFEAAQLGKKIMILNNNTLRNYKNIFPGQIELFSDAKDLMDKYREVISRPDTRYDLSEYSEETLFSELTNSLGDI